MQTITQTKRLTTIALLSAIAYLIMFVGRIPVVLFLKYDPKDVIITIGGFLYGPVTAFLMSLLVSFVEMVTVSDTGPIGAVMNIISTCSFACAAAYIYKVRHDIKGAVIGLSVGCLLMVAVMMLWNYFIAPIYMAVPREEVAKLLLPAFLPFNLLKGGLNAAFTMLLYKPISVALRRSNLMPVTEGANGGKSKINAGVILVSCFVIATCVVTILVLQGKI
ncbi:MAG: ECF transporter S component [Clostridiales bacterium]|jgi:riboflavin transporter FmnP|nr:ECF transporter S component [Clostridiales bacterium]